MKVLNFFSIIVLASIVFFSCSKEDDAIEIKPERLISNEETKNQSNKHDRIGLLHNDYLDFFIRRSDYKDGIDKRYLLTITREFYSHNDLTYNEEDIIGAFDVYAKLDADGISLNDAFESQLPTICEYIPALCDIGDTGPYNPYPFPDFNFMSSGNNTDKVLDFIARTKRLEAEVSQSDEYTDEQKELIHTYLAVARYSHQYWHNQLVLGDLSPWEDYLEEDMMAKACPVCKADLRGAIVGFFTGGGVIAGAGVASLAKAIDILIDILWPNEEP